MSKSNYEIYAEKRQKELLQEMRPFAICLAHLKSNKMHFSKEYLEAQNWIGIFFIWFNFWRGK